MYLENFTNKFFSNLHNLVYLVWILTWNDLIILTPVLSIKAPLEVRLTPDMVTLEHSFDTDKVYFR